MVQLTDHKNKNMEGANKLRENTNKVSHEIIVRLEALDKRTQKSDLQKTIETAGLAFVRAKSILDKIDFKNEKPDVIARLTNAWIAWKDDGIFAGEQFKDLRANLQGMLKLGNKEYRYVRQLWRTDIVKYVLDKIKDREDKALLTEAIMGAQEVREEPREAISSIKLKGVNKEAVIKKMEEGRKCEYKDIAKNFGGEPHKIRVVTGGALLEIQNDYAEKFKFKNMAQEGSTIYAQMENGCKGNFVIIEIKRSAAIKKEDSPEKPRKKLIPPPVKKRTERKKPPRETARKEETKVERAKAKPKEEVTRMQSKVRPSKKDRVDSRKGSTEAQEETKEERISDAIQPEFEILGFRNKYLWTTIGGKNMWRMTKGKIIIGYTLEPQADGKFVGYFVRDSGRTDNDGQVIGDTFVVDSIDNLKKLLVTKIAEEEKDILNNRNELPVLQARLAMAKSRLENGNIEFNYAASDMSFFKFGAKDNSVALIIDSTHFSDGFSARIANKEGDEIPIKAEFFPELLHKIKKGISIEKDKNPYRREARRNNLEYLTDDEAIANKTVLNQNGTLVIPDPNHFAWVAPRELKDDFRNHAAFVDNYATEKIESFPKSRMYYFEQEFGIKLTNWGSELYKWKDFRKHFEFDIVPAVKKIEQKYPGLLEKADEKGVTLKLALIKYVAWSDKFPWLDIGDSEGYLPAQNEVQFDWNESAQEIEESILSGLEEAGRKHGFKLRDFVKKAPISAPVEVPE